MKKVILAAVAASMIASPVLAANPAQSLSVAKVEKKNRGGVIVALLAIGAIAGGIIAVSKDDDKPDSN